MKSPAASAAERVLKAASGHCMAVADLEFVSALKQNKAISDYGE
jgi:hypothetical protein